MVKKSVINKHIKDLERTIRELRQYQKYPQKDFEENLSLLWTIEQSTPDPTISSG